MRLIDYDSWLAPFALQLEKRRANFEAKTDDIETRWGSLLKFASTHKFFGLHRQTNGWFFREWPPKAPEV